MRRKTALIALVCILLLARKASAHRLDEYLQATILSLKVNRVQASMRLVPGVLVASSVIAGIDSNGDGVFSESEKQGYAQRVLEDLSITTNGQNVEPKLVSGSFPEPAQMRDGAGTIRINYSLDLPSGGLNRTLILANHYSNSTSVYLMNVEAPRDPGIRIVAQKRNQQQSVYELDYQQGPVGANWSTWVATPSVLLKNIQFSSLFHLGMRHIAEGTDHLLFLLTLLLPAPLLVSGRRWGLSADVHQSLLRILSIVTAFTLGHSTTLGLAALGLVRVPERPIEVLIAASILVSAFHAFRPLLAGREAWIAAFFGLIHGLAFAATLDLLGLGRWERVGGILAFNLGIESMQMLVVALILPSLLLMSRTRLYPIVRTGGALFAGAASVAWIVERVLDVQTPVDSFMNVLAQRGLWVAGVLFLASLVCRYLLTESLMRTSPGEDTNQVSKITNPISVSD